MTGFEKLKQNSKIKQLNDFLNKNKSVCVRGLNIGERGFIAGTNERAIIIVPDLIAANQYNSQLLSLGYRSQIVMRGFDTPLFVYAQDLNALKQMISGVSKFLVGELDFLVVNCEALFQRLPKKENLFALVLEKQERYSLDFIVKKLIELGYSRRTICTSQGEFSLRGDILDVFVDGNDYPIRLDFFDDVLEKIYTFNPENMNKIEDVEKAILTPQTIFCCQDLNEVKNNLVSAFKNKNTELFENVLSAFESDGLNLNLSFVLPFFEFDNNILSICDETIFVDEPKKVFQTIETLKQGFYNEIEKLIFENKLLESHRKFYYDKLEIPKDNGVCYFENIQTSLTFDLEQAFSSLPSKKYVFDFNALVSDLKVYSSNGMRIVLFAGDEQTCNTLKKNLLQKDVKIINEFNFNKGDSGVFVVKDFLFSSINIWESNIFFFATNDIVKKVEKSHFKKKNSFYLPKINEFVVHDFHGIGKCVDILRLKLGESEKDYFVIEYAGGDKIYIPSENVDSISAYVGGELEPKLNKLGGLEFSKIKERAKKSISALAIDLLKLYKERENAKGFVFEKDSYLQQEFENCFEFEETEDQLRAIEQIKSDMCSDKVMDRLVCGDVGYGKTEVALRGVYKAILSGKQVAFLAPTTILSQQHFKTCLKRFKDFMVRVEVLNRLVPIAKQKQILRDLKDGKVDLLIGTHRILRDDVEFKDLGLLVLDEEQRFGVGDKEKIKDIKKNIDVLTLSATPIPRTLHMSLSGIRDISLIETPPKNRISVQTFVCEYDEKIIVDACQKELSRNGQILIVYNRVESIYDFANYIKNLLPNVKIGVAHGQMPSNILEDSVLKLYNGEYQVFIATTLIENGIDLPNANTLIVIDSDRLGLASLYQLKGRVGRSNRVAYAYFTYNKNKVLTEDAYKRLSAICEFSSLGSGFKIALRDLEIRGAGSLLGKQQHGHIEKIGYDLYCRLLDEAIGEIKGEKQKQSREIKMDIDLDAYINETTIPDENLRISYYSQISLLENFVQAKQVYNNILESFGEVPIEIVNLMKIALIKNILSKHNVKRVLIDSKNCKLFLYKEENILDDFLSKLIEKSGVGVLKFDALPIIDFVISKNTTEKCDYILNLLFEGEKFDIKD